MSFLARGGREYFLAMAVCAFARSFPSRTPLSMLDDEGEYRCLGDVGSCSAVSSEETNYQKKITLYKNT